MALLRRVFTWPTNRNRPPIFRHSSANFETVLADKKLEVTYQIVKEQFDSAVLSTSPYGEPSIVALSNWWTIARTKNPTRDDALERATSRLRPDVILRIDRRWSTASGHDFLRIFKPKMAAQPAPSNQLLIGASWRRRPGTTAFPQAA